MAQLDANIFLQQQGADFDKASQGFERGMKLGEMVRQRKTQELEQQKQNDIKEAYNSAYETRPDGSSFFNPQRVSEYLKSKGLGLEAQKFDQDYQAQQSAQLKSQVEAQQNQNAFVSNILGSVRDQASYTLGKKRAVDAGIPGANQLPDVYDPQVVDGLRKQYGAGSMSYAQQLDDARKNKEAEARAAEASLDAKYKKAQIDKINSEITNKYAPKSTEKKLADLGAGEKQRLDYIKSGLDSITRMDDALAGGEFTFSVVGDNNFTKAKREASESYGRMQSGGAISLPEEERFDKASPGKTDSIEIQRSKLADQQKMFLDRLKTMGFSPEELGIEVKPIKYGSGQSQQPAQKPKWAK